MPGSIINVPVQLNDLALDVKLTSPATGAIQYRAADGFWTDLDPPGVAGQVLQSNGGLPFWGAGSVVDISGKYDKSGGPLTGPILINQAPPVSANSGQVSLGAAPFDGATAGFFTGLAGGTQLAINAATAFTGALADWQVNGVSKFRVNTTGRVVNSFLGVAASDNTSVAFFVQPSGTKLAQWFPFGAAYLSSATTPDFWVGLGDISLKDTSGNLRMRISAGSVGTAICGYSFGLPATMPMALVNEIDQITSLGINVPQVGTRVTTSVGGIFRLDCRSGTQGFLVLGYPTGGSTGYERFFVNLQNGRSSVCYQGAAADTWGAFGTFYVGFPTSTGPVASLMVNGRAYANSDFICDNSARGFVLKSPSGHYWRFVVSDAGVLSAGADLGTGIPVAP
jgi:hypothetical protein